MYFLINYLKNVLFIFFYFFWVKGKMILLDLFIEIKIFNDKFE